MADFGVSPQVHCLYSKDGRCLDGKCPSNAERICVKYAAYDAQVMDELERQGAFGKGIISKEQLLEDLGWSHLYERHTWRDWVNWRMASVVVTLVIIILLLTGVLH